MSTFSLRILMSAAAIGSLAFCSCQSLSSKMNANHAPIVTQAPDQPRPLPGAATTRSLNDIPPAVAVTRNPYPGRPHREYNPPRGPIAPVPTSQVEQAAHHGPQCECCKKKDLRGGYGGCPKFAFETEAPTGPFVPPGIGQPWPYDEYLWNGCDINNDVRVKQDWSVVGLDPQDTVIHYDTLAGDTKVKPANCVPIYAPRFASVRKVVDPIGFEGHERIVEANNPQGPMQQLERAVVTTAVQPIQPIDKGGIKGPEALLERNRGIEIDEAKMPHLARVGFLPFEDLLLIRRGEYVDSEKARIAQRAEAALAWTSNQKVQVVIDGKMAFEAKNTNAPQGTYVFESGEPCVRICKIADKSEANPGEIITFTLRFDNVGDQPVGNVTIIDNLISRLEYVEGSQSCSRDADFIPSPNTEESLTLRWEIKEPLPPLAGGIIRFKCRLR